MGCVYLKGLLDAVGRVLSCFILSSSKKSKLQEMVLP